MSDLTHLDDAGHARMVDVAAREVTTRTATASGRVTTTAAALIRAGDVPKGDVLAVARIAGIMATKRTPDLIPLCHPIAVHGVDMEVAVAPADDEVFIRATVRTADRTGVEMEALTAVAVAGLAVIDMIKAVDPHAALRDVQVEAKGGGRNGPWQR
jgi:cyclic pyranopterin phosphate synthase